jgi:hypothetical protein
VAAAGGFSLDVSVKQFEPHAAVLLLWRYLELENLPA